MTSILVLRHGQSTWNAEGRWQGWADPPLTPLGEAQARAALPALAAHGFGAIITSDLQRAVRTSDIVAEALKITRVRIEPGLRERSMGTWTGLTTESIAERWPDATKGRNIGMEALPPGGERPGRFPARVREALLRAARDFVDDRILAIAHGAVIQMLEEQLGVEPDPHVPALGGRWFGVDGDELRAGERFAAIVEHPT